MKTCLYRPFRRTKSCIDLWIAPTEVNLETATPETVSSDYLDMMGSEEKQRFSRLRLESDRRRYLVSHVLLRTALSRTAKERVDPRCWRYGRNKHGKPTIATTAGLPHLNFSLSHSKRLAVVAVSSTSDVGVDVESLDRTIIADPADIGLSPGEHAWLRSRPPATRQRDFVKLWTVKEAYVKLLGRGFFLDFSSFEIAMDPLRVVRTETGVEQPPDLQLATQEIRMHDGLYQLSLAVKCSPLRNLKVVLHVFDSQLIESKHQKNLLRAG